MEPDRREGGVSYAAQMVAILKMRAGPHDHAMRELRVSAKGLEVGKPFDRSELVLTGLALPR